MSLRPEVYGFRLDALRELLGSKDQETLERLSEQAEDRGVAAILARAINEGAPFKGLEEEGQAHVVAAHLLATENQPELWDSGSSIWKIQPTEIVFDAGAQLSERGTQLIEHLMGRALFGETIESDWATYGWLSRAEVKELVDELSGAATASLANPAIAALIVAFRGWLAEIEKRGLDLWYLAN